MRTVTIPPRVSLGSFPTRIQYLARQTEEIGGPSLYVKRDDETGADLSGNKVRKLEFLLAEARDQESDLVITCGGVQSNHCRATAIAARRLGMDSLLFLRGEDPGERDGNLLLDTLVGADLRFITPEEYADRASLLEAAAAEAMAAGRRPYVIPEGGSNAVGAFGYLTAMDELIRQGLPSEAGAGGRGGPVGTMPSFEPTVFPWDHIVCATGSGGTLAGLILGAMRNDLTVRIWGVNVCDSALYFARRITGIGEQFRLRYLPHRTDPLIRPEDVRILEGYKGPGYAQAYPEMLDLARETARRDGILLDPVYTGKAFHGLLTEARNGRFKKGERVLFIHTGGVFSLFAWKKELLGG